MAVEATGATLGDTFAAVASGLTAAMCDEIPDTGEAVTISVRAENREAVLFDYLDELIYERDVRSVLPTAHTATVTQAGDEWVVEATFRGVPLSDVVARDVKAVTYSEMHIGETDDGWEAYVVFDV